MDTSTAPAARTGPRVTLWLLRTVSALLLLAVLAQPVLAGLYLSGEWDALGVHSGISNLLDLLAVVLLVVGLVYWLGGRGRGRFAVATTLLFLATWTQSVFGHARLLGLHIPLGVALVTAAVLFTIWIWRPGARTPRRTRRGGAR